MTLFFAECRRISRSLVFIAFVAVLLVFYVSQLGDYAGRDIREVQSGASYDAGNPLMAPPAGADSYGSRRAEIPEQVMPGALQQLAGEYFAGEYITYPISFYKVVRPGDAVQSRIAEILYELSGVTPDVLEARLDAFNALLHQAYTQGGNTQALSPDFPLAVSDYALFKARMEEVDSLLGTGSAYATDRLSRYGHVPVTYKEKLAEHDAFLTQDRVTGAYARLFCDYIGIVIALFGVFVPAALLLSDRQTGASAPVYARRRASLSIVGARYAASVAMLLLPVLLLSLWPTSQLMLYGAKNGLDVDILGYYRYIFAWLLPTAMTVCAVGFFFTLLTDTPLGIAIQFIWSFAALSASVPVIYGGSYGAQLMIRHNTLLNLTVVQEGIAALTRNRIAYASLSLLIMLLSAYIYELKRRGTLDIRASFTAWRTSRGRA